MGGISIGAKGGQGPTNAAGKTVLVNWRNRLVSGAVPRYDHWSGRTAHPRYTENLFETLVGK